MRPTLRRLPASCLGLLLLAFVPSVRAPAAVIEVNSTADDLLAGDGLCTLHEAVENANTDSDTTDGDCSPGDGADRIHIPPGEYAYDRVLNLTDDAILLGAGANATRLVMTDTNDVVSSIASLSLERLALSGGRCGGIGASGESLTIVGSEISGNSDENCRGNVIATVMSRASETTIRDSALVDNEAPAISSWGRLVVVNSTISGNVAHAHCLNPPPSFCSCLWFPIIQHEGFGLLQNVTIANNSFDTSECIPPSQLPPVISSVNFEGNRWVELSDSIVWNPAIPDCCPFVNLQGVNLAEGVDPLLGPLQNHGGPTWTHALLPGSPAKNAIPVADCAYDDDGDPGTPDVPLATDQRGVARPQGAGCDIGAFEQSVCGLGAELALLLPLLGAPRRRGHSPRTTR